MEDVVKYLVIGRHFYNPNCEEESDDRPLSDFETEAQCRPTVDRQLRILENRTNHVKLLYFKQNKNLLIYSFR